jgi:hypothetical protein
LYVEREKTWLRAVRVTSRDRMALRLAIPARKHCSLTVSFQPMEVE